MTITATAPRAAAYRGKLRWWTELPLIAVVYALYSAARLVVRGDVDDAVEHGADILHFEQLTHLDPERWFNRLFTDHAFLGVPADFAYASLHYIVTPTILVWLWRRRPTHYRVARTWLMISTLIGLIGFTLLPTAPPRLLPGTHGFMDTMAQYGSYGWWGTDASAPRGMGHLTNQYAAMPSLHVGWSLWCGLMLWRYGRNWFVRTLGVIYPLMTAFVVMGTANHYLMDAAAGVAVMGIGFLLAKPALRTVDAVRERIETAVRGRKGALAGTEGSTGSATAGSTKLGSASVGSASVGSTGAEGGAGTAGAGAGVGAAQTGSAAPTPAAAGSASADLTAAPALHVPAPRPASRTVSVPRGAGEASGERDGDGGGAGDAAYRNGGERAGRTRTP